MMGFTKDWQIDSTLLRNRDKRFDINSYDKRSKRGDIPEPAVQPEANAWEKGVVVQIQSILDKMRPNGR